MSEEDPKLNLDSLDKAFQQASSAGESVSGKDPSKLTELASAAPIVHLVDSLLHEAVKRRASDIHVEAFEDDLSIRYRIDGRCYKIANPPHTLTLAIASRIKVIANLDVAESRVPQDGRILLNFDDRQIDLRVSTLPTIHGESIVMRVLDKGALDKTLGDLGIGEKVQESIEQIIEQPHGLLLVTGPTGAGKTTTLYACLAKRNKPDVKLITTEDPVEYDIDGLVQVAINHKISLDFATCLRAILRHDPDVIMVGEIRDKDTAQVAIQASLTGHLVFSTLHTNDAPGTVTRLLDMGIEPFLVSSTISGILAQRLIRALCPDCKAPYESSQEELEAIHLSREDLKSPLMKAVGCDSCQGLGYKGRLGIYELLTMSDEIRALIIKRENVSIIRDIARKQGMRTLREDVTDKVLSGLTTVEEMLRETQDYE